MAMALDDAKFVDWLLERQHRDGSWGGGLAFATDRLMQTLMVLRALLALSRHGVNPSKTEDALARGIRYSVDALKRWNDREALLACDVAGFEMLVPAHWIALCGKGVNLPPLPPELEARWRQKMSSWPRALFSGRPPSHVLYIIDALEAWPDGERLTRDVAHAVDPEQLAGFSPSATAYLLRCGNVDENRAARFRLTLHNARNQDGGYASTVPMGSFILLWRMYFDVLAGLGQEDEIGRAFDNLMACHELAAGIGCNPSFEPDGDDTAVALVLAARFRRAEMARRLARSLLDRFYDAKKGFFRTYPFELTGSITTNAHIVEALRTASPFLAGDPAAADIANACRRAASYLLEGASIRDKWHVSIYYSILACVQALQEGPDAGEAASAWAEWRRRTLRQILANRRPDGGWGIHDEATGEETSYALLSLLALAPWAEQPEQIIPVVTHAISFLRSWNDNASLELWIGKGLYQPIEIVGTVIEAAQVLGERYLKQHQ
ncbi:MAG TPA: hypothetical protein VH877_28665 [Polyangia bacterium]|nr:hypothetical protein [Polyangia bacterium]